MPPCRHPRRHRAAPCPPGVGGERALVVGALDVRVREVDIAITLDRPEFGNIAVRKLTDYVGNYSAYLKERDARMERLRQMKKDPLIRRALGDHIYEHYVEAKQASWDEYSSTVHPWELERYLARY